MVEVEHQPQMVAADRLHQRQAVVGAGERHARMVHRGVQVLQDEGDPVLRAEPGDPAERARRRKPHLAGHLGGGRHGQAVAVQAGPVQVEPGYPEPPRHRYGLGGGRQQLLGPGRVGALSGGPVPLFFCRAVV